MREAAVLLQYQNQIKSYAAKFYRSMVIDFRRMWSFRDVHQHAIAIALHCVRNCRDESTLGHYIAASVSRGLPSLYRQGKLRRRTESLYDDRMSITNRYDAEDHSGPTVGHLMFLFNDLVDGAGLTDREKFVLRKRYVECVTLRDIGEMLGGLSHERVRQIESKALDKVRSIIDEESVISEPARRVRRPAGRRVGCGPYVKRNTTHPACHG